MSDKNKKIMTLLSVRKSSRDAIKWLKTFNVKLNGIPVILMNNGQSQLVLEFLEKENQTIPSDPLPSSAV